MQLKTNYSLKNHNTFGVESFSKYFAEVNNLEDLTSILKLDEIKGLPILFLGGGSNILLTKDFNGLTILLNLKGIKEQHLNYDEVLLTAQAGENWHQFVQYSLEKNYGGLENLSLIPGNVGTCPIQNIGAYGVEIKDHFESCQVLNLETLEVETFNKEKCNFGYRDSFFKQEGKGKYVILEVSFRLTKRNHFIRTDYGAIQQELSSLNVTQPSIQEVAQAVINIRTSKLPNPKELGNAGSFFKNPSVSTEDYQNLQKQFPNLPGYPQGNQTKVPAGWLIEQTGWKGKQIGNVATHHLQALVIINATGNATGEEIYHFSSEIITSVKNTFGITLEREVNII
ncbi:UDP-N-acetylmuramate dehydrogenase [Riemerella anatipestifer]|uniref:UDP-N-acetylmuramate dehydrogenase n=1 Tax=Riemerella anatipestifer TaxID=34085 RepID=UPI0007EDE5FF|nr:UDP-N-acetylmuramate dehydrogenase [Riemerella anatipestifer]AZZ58798.1 UDP-N-acetylmuramate dehydrogenase [Riemerella anatipestifer]MCO7317847.1 UDP-N-acetylmuramate dehydrogenase [Riemerella anatipestifer]MCQ4154002.1 UDP-N-acetylmuramate dehydrogenase [Riemerella anatipestifer]MCQ4180015.1 UDP-N-acetylmuramate dehydrogenase [Riemerella anatipestifer]MCW0473241.1 UDP-N-acetylmuramate dehydrogenase [Riemerella anatipestifer]